MSTATGYHSLWVTDSPADADYRRNTQPWTWARLRAVSGWELGRRYRDEIGEGFWMHRTPWVAAPHVEVRTRSWQTHTRHAFLVTGTRAALLTCFDECRHAHGELLNVIGQHTPESADDGAGPAPWRHLRVPAKPQRGRHLSLTSTQGAVHVELRQGTARLARLTFTSRQWTPEQIHDAAAGLLEQTDR
ncbi:hypothetical protein ACIBL5_06525 [Streptomyces sp. NPDC050516]|uniref:hypothetical protein n=1 Tax=Streptomyces sp. NPDC050516 TaxID=3365621 RepID=UPI0037A403F7